MDGMDITAFVVMALMAAIAIGLIAFLGGWPGRVAKRLNHPYADAITVGGWATLILGGVGWPLVLIWAYAPPGGKAWKSSQPTDTSALVEPTMHKEIESATESPC